ncbi:putative polysaccharide biosynthesis protein [Fusibacter bizertensis]
MTKSNEQNASDSFVKGAFILGISGVFVKIIGAFFKIPLADNIGPEGMSYFSSAYSFYNFFIVLATAGLPTAIGKIIAEQRALGDYKNLDKMFKSGFVLMTSVGLLGSLFMFFGADIIVDVIKNPDASLAFKSIAPAIVIVSVMAVFRGFFQGFQHMKPFALSQIFEQFGRVTVGFGLAIYLLASGTKYAAAGATFGATTGALAGLFAIFLMYKSFRKKHKEAHSKLMTGQAQTTSEIMKRIALIAVPITLGAAVMPLMSTIDVMLVMNRLTDIGMGEQANDLYGMLSGYAAVLVNLPQVITSAIQISIVPAVAALFVQKQVKNLSRTIQNGIRMTLIISLPATAGLVLLSQPIMELLYPSQIQYAQTTGQILSILGFGVIFLGMFQVTTGILQGLSMQNRPAINLMVGAVIKIILTYVLVGIPSINIYGAAFSTLAAYGTATTLNLITMKRSADITFDPKVVLFKPLFSVLVMSVVVVVGHKLALLVISPKLSTVFAILIGAIVYFVMLLKTKTITDEDYALLPGGRKLKKISDRFFK